MNKILFVYNPVSGNRGVVNRLDYIIDRFQMVNYLVIPYRVNNYEEDLLTEMLRSHIFDIVVVSGGDGSVNYVVNVLLKSGLDIPLGIIPSGTCNDFAASINIVPSIEQSIDHIIYGKIKEVDVGLVNGDRYFMSTCAGGVFADVSFSTHSDLKKNFGPFAYYIKAMSEVKNIKPFRISVKTEKEQFEEEIILFMILNGRQGGGFSNLVDDADISDGLMDLVLFKSCSSIDLAAIFFSVLTNVPLNNKNVKMFQAKSCSLEADQNIDLSIDGERGVKLPIKVEFLNKALKVLVNDDI